ncbi:MAG: CAP domain-containing protein [Acutalibacteraceae bacterium]
MKKVIALILTIIISVGSMTIVSATDNNRLTGDINNDGTVSVIDAVLMQKHLSDILTLDENTLSCADVDGSGSINFLDAILIQKYSLSLITEFPANATEPTQPTEPSEKPTEAPTEKPTEPTTKPETVTPNEMELEILRLVNEERAKLGRKELKFGYFYYEAAQTRAKELETLFSHTRPDGRNCFTALLDIGVNTELNRYAGENCARYYPDAKSVMNDFMNSKEHRQNIVSSRFDYLAVAVYESKQYPGYYTVEQLFLSDVGPDDDYIFGN